MLSTRTTRPLKPLALALALAALAVPTAQGKLDVGGSRHVTPAGKYGPLDPWASSLNHRSSPTPLDGRSPDTRDAAIAATMRAHQSSPTPLDGRSPDTTDAALLAHSPVVTLTTPSVFAWREFGIGAAAAFAAVLLAVGVATLTVRRGRGRLVGF
jgi:hypothetical protein